MKKKLISSLLILMVLVSLLPDAAQATKPIKIIIHGTEVKSDTSPFIENNRTMVPIRVISEYLGYNVDWDAETQSIAISNDNENTMTNEGAIGLYIGKPIIVIFNPETITKYNNMLINNQITIEDAGIKIFENSKIVDLDVAPKIVNNHTYVPIRVISEYMGLTVEWDERIRAVAIGDLNTLSQFNTFNPSTEIPYFNLEIHLLEIEDIMVSTYHHNPNNLISTADMVAYSGDYINELQKLFEEYLDHLEEYYNFKNKVDYLKIFEKKREEFSNNIESNGSMATLEYNYNLINYTFDELELLNNKYTLEPEGFKDIIDY